MQKAFEIFAGILILFFMGVVIWQSFHSNNYSKKSDQSKGKVEVKEIVVEKDQSSLRITNPKEGTIIYTPEIRTESEYKLYVPPSVIWEANTEFVGCDYQVFLNSQSETSSIGSGTLSGSEEINGLIVTEDTYNPTKYYYSGDYVMRVAVTCPLGHAREGTLEDSINIEHVYTGLPPTEPITDNPVACTMDAKQCPDGSYVGRVAPDCAFAECPYVEEEKDETVISTKDFNFALEEELGTELWMPDHGYTPESLMKIFTGLRTWDFDGVEAGESYYLYHHGQVKYETYGIGEVAPSERTITEEGFSTLLENLIWRMTPELGDDISVEDIIYVLRTGNAPETASKTIIECSSESKLAEECAAIYAPVCGLVEVQCITAPCDPIPQTYSNSCAACMENNVNSYTEGACEA